MTSKKRKNDGADCNGEHEKQMQRQLGALVSSLRNDPAFADAEISVLGKTFHVHRAVLSVQSQFFYKAFSGPFQEAEKRQLETSVAAVSPLLDYVYGIQTMAALKGNTRLACEVLSLAHRFDFEKLFDWAAIIALSTVSVNTCIGLYLCLKRFGSGRRRDVLLFIVRRLADVSRSADFHQISVDDLLAFIFSEQVLLLRLKYTSPSTTGS